MGACARHTCQGRRHLLRPRQRLCVVLAAHPPPTDLRLLAVDYRLAPRHRFPTAADDVRAGWDWLTSQVPPDRVVIAGDSAGGHLSVDLLLQPARAAHRPGGVP